MGGLDYGMDYGEHPSYSSFGEGGAGAGLQSLEGSYLRSLLLLLGLRLLWFHVLPLCPALAPLLTHISHTLAIPVCS